jgi:hypothetical protein
MPPTNELDDTHVSSQEIAALRSDLVAAVSERDRLRAELDARANTEVASWLTIVADESRALREIQQTLSWRITKPLRLVRKVQKKTTEVGVVAVSQLAVADLRRRFRGSRR